MEAQEDPVTGRIGNFGKWQVGRGDAKLNVGGLYLDVRSIGLS